MHDPHIDKGESEPVAVSTLSSPDLDLTEVDIDENNSNHWGSVNANEYTSVGLDPCALLVFRSPDSDTTFVGHFYDPIFIPGDFNSMLSALEKEYPDKSKIRVDCFGVSNNCELDFSPSEESHTEKKREQIVAALKNNGYEQVHTYWTEAAKVSVVQINGRTREIEYLEHYSENEDDLLDDY